MAFSVPRNSKTRPLTIIAQDPSVVDQSGEPLLTSVDVPAEELAPGPCGYRVRVVDYDSSTGTLYRPLSEGSRSSSYIDPFANKAIEELLETPQFHQQNVYAIAMRVLRHFEFALGRRVSWQFKSHQIKIVPHAFREANAFYSRDHEAVLFGYFAAPSKATPKDKKRLPENRIYTCLSHDIVAHEITHAILDGVRERFIYPSLPDQAAFHEGFADVVAILSVVSVPELVESILTSDKKGEVQIRDDDDEEFKSGTTKSIMSLNDEIELIAPLASLAEQMGGDSDTARSSALRDSLRIEPNRTALTEAEFQLPHRRGELLVAAVLRSVLKIAKRRALKVSVADQHKYGGRIVSGKQMAEAYAEAARDVLTICIRGLDYLAPVHVTFGGFLAAILTADAELIGNDSSYRYREVILESFGEYGISSLSQCKEGVWKPLDDTRWLRSERTDHHAMMFNPDEVFRYVWENREPLQLSDAYYTRVTVVNPTVRVGPDGMIVCETVVEYVQSATLRGDELHRFGLRRPPSMPPSAKIELLGGGTLIFDVRGKLKYHLRFPVDDPRRQNPIIEDMSNRGLFIGPGSARRSRTSFARLHEQRALRTIKRVGDESWP